MLRRTSLLQVNPDQLERVESALRALAPDIREAAMRLDVRNYSLWAAENLLFGYGEYGRDADLDDEPALRARLETVIDGRAQLLCPTGSMRLMYHDIGIVREDKSLIRHRVFATKLKPGCAGEYKRRHDALVEARGDSISEGPDSNFTIWYGAGYIFGYCEKVRAFDHEMTEQERRDTIAWETRQLEIMDWLTDDVDWITGEKHDKMRLVCRQ